MWHCKGVSQIHLNNDISLGKQVHVIGVHFISTLLVDISNYCFLFKYTWYDDKYWYKIVISTIQAPVNDIKVKVIDLEFSCLKILSEGISSFDPLIQVGENIVFIIGNLHYLLILIV